MTEEMPSTITISSTATAATGLVTDDIESESNDNARAESMELMSREELVDKDADDNGDNFAVPAAVSATPDDNMDENPPIPTETEALYATVSMVNARQKSQFPPTVPTGCLVDAGMVMARVSECAKLLNEDDATTVMLNHATGLADNLSTFVSSVKGVMDHLKVSFYIDRFHKFFI